MTPPNRTPIVFLPLCGEGDTPPNRTDYYLVCGQLPLGRYTYTDLVGFSFVEDDRKLRPTAPLTERETQ